MNPCIEPVPVVDPNGEDRWLNQHKKFVREAQDLDPEVIFIGDSIIQYMQLTSVWMKWFVPMHALNFGIGGDSTQHVLWRVNNGELEHCKPKAVVVLVGTNNISNDGEQVAEGIVEIARSIRRVQPEAYVILLTLLPRGKVPNPNREKNVKVNELLKAKAGSIPKCEVVTIGAGIVQTNGEIDAHDMFDYLHLTAAGYERVFEPVHDLLTQILTENEPEPDLDNILEN